MSVVHGGNVVADGPILLAAGVAALAGLLSFASPCCLPLVPGYLSLVSGSLGAHLVSARGRDCAAPDQSPDRSARLRTTAGAVLFVAGVAAVFTAYGAAFGALGRALVLHQRALTVALGSLTVLLGVSFAGLLPRAPWAWRSWRVSYRPRAGLLGAPLLGVLFGLGWTPCIGPVLGSVLGYTAAATSSPLRGALYLNIGHTGLDYAGLPGWLRKLGVKPVYLVHDLIPITHPQFCRAGEAQKHRARMRHALQSASGIIYNSSATQEAMEQFAQQQGLPVPQGLVAWLGADEQVPAAVLPAPRRPYFVMIGTIEARKNHQMVLQLWKDLVAELGEPAPELVLVGQRGWEADAVFALLDGDPELADHVREMGRCDDATMFALLDGARALLMPSFIEGFGIPVIEALQRGTPVIASDLAVFREISGEIPLFLDPADRAAWHAAVLDFTGDNAARQRQIALMPQFTPPDWTGHFAAVDAWLDGL